MPLPCIEAKAHFPFVTKILIDLLNEGSLPNVKALNVEPRYGYAGRILYHNGVIRYFKSSCFGINNMGASEIAKDKGYTKYFLNSLGYSTPKGKVFLTPFYFDEVNKSVKFGPEDFDSIDDLPDYIDNEIGYPCFIKPNDESQGRNANKCNSFADVKCIVEDLNKSKIKLFLVEELIKYPDYRIVVFNNKIISCYLREPLMVLGDGKLTICQLIGNKQEEFAKQGRSTRINLDDNRILNNLERKQLTFESVPINNEVVVLQDVSNLSAGGIATDCLLRIHPYWKDLCLKMTKDMGLVLCGVDLACDNIENSNSFYSVLEMNAAPGLDNYASSGNVQKEIVKKLYQEIFNTNL